MLKPALAITVALTFAACDSKPQTEAERQAYVATQEAACKPILIATAEDGTKLWKINGRDCDAVTTTVYFSSSGGTNWRSGGKTKTTHTVPHTAGATEGR